MKKFLILIIFFNSMVGCSHAYIASWDRQNVTTCCPQEKLLCNQDKLYELAKKQCGGSAEALSGGMVNSGEMASYNSTFGGANMSVRNTKDQCAVFKCTLK